MENFIQANLRISFFFFLNFFGCVGSLLLRAGFLQLWRAGATLCCSARASYCGGFSCCEAQALGTRASVVVAHGLSSCSSRALEHRVSSCGAQAQLLHSMWDLPGPGFEPVSPALAGGFLTTAPPGKPQSEDFNPGNSLSKSSEGFQRIEGEASIYVILVKGCVQ